MTLKKCYLLRVKLSINSHLRSNNVGQTPTTVSTVFYQNVCKYSNTSVTQTLIDVKKQYFNGAQLYYWPLYLHLYLSVTVMLRTLIQQRGNSNRSYEYMYIPLLCSLHKNNNTYYYFNDFRNEKHGKQADGQDCTWSVYLQTVKNMKFATRLHASVGTFFKSFLLFTTMHRQGIKF